MLERFPLWFGVWFGGGDCSPRIVSPDQSSEAIPFADGGGIDEPLVPLAIAEAHGVDDALPLHVYHHSVDCALVAAGIQSHALDDLRAGLGTVFNQGGADGVAGESGEVHWVVW